MAFETFCVHNPLSCMLKQKSSRKEIGHVLQDGGCLFPQ